MTTDRMRKQQPHPVLDMLKTAPPEDVYAWLLGKFVLSMAEIDYALADAVAAVRGDEHEDATAAWGKSGEQLLKLLKRQVEAVPAVQPLIDEYARLYESRNSLVHAMYTPSVTPGSHGSTHLQSSTKKRPSPYVSDEHVWDQGDLCHLLTAAETLLDRAIVLGTHRTADLDPAAGGERVSRPAHHTTAGILAALSREATADGTTADGFDATRSALGQC